MRPVETVEGAFTEFARAAEPKLRYALVAGYGPERGRDAAAEALAYGWQHWERIKAMDNPAGYLYRVGQRAATRQRAPRPLFRPVPVEHAPWVEPALPQALGRLTRNQRIAVVLVHAFEWSQSEVGELMGVSKSSVQRHLERGLAKLRKALEVQSDAGS